MLNDISFLKILRFIQRAILLNVAVLLLMGVFRLAFCLYYGDMTHLSLYPLLLIKAFWMGARYDAAVIAYINGLVTLTFSLVWILRSDHLFRVWQRFVRWYYFLAFALVFIILSVDFGFYSYFKTHVNILIFGVFEDDTKALFSTIRQNYNLYQVGGGFLGLMGFIFLLVFTTMRLKGPNLRDAYQIIAHTNARASGWMKTGIIVGLVVLNFIVARGSFGMFPLGVMDAEISPDLFINKIGINGIFTLQEAIEFRMKENTEYDLAALLGYKGDLRRAFADFLGRDQATLDPVLSQNLVKRTRVNQSLEQAKVNVIVIMMEGFGSDLLHYQSPTFDVMGALQQHFATDTVFYNFLSGDVGTIGSLETALLTLPKRPMTKPITQSRYAFNDYPFGAALPYKRAGYDTIFLYGGNIGWRNVMAFLPRAGFSVTEGAGAMPSSYERNQWGVYDEHLFEHIYRKLSEGVPGRPKFIFALSTSNHPPYSLPSTYTPLPLTPSPELQRVITGDRKLAQARFMTYQYACQKLGEFLTRLKSSEYARNTIVAVTGDHNFWSVFDYPRERYLDLDGVPFYLYIPPSLKPPAINASVFGSHADIMPTLYHLSLSSATYMSVGKNMLDPSEAHVAYNVDGLAMTGDVALRYSMENDTAQYFVWNSTHPRRLADSPATPPHAWLLKYYKAAMTITDYLLKETGK